MSVLFKKNTCCQVKLGDCLIMKTPVIQLEIPYSAKVTVETINSFYFG